MKIRVEKTKIIQALRKLEGIEIVLENEEDVREALGLIMGREDLFGGPEFKSLKEVRVSEAKEYKTSSVHYEVFYLLEFVFNETVTPGEKAAAIKTVQAFFEGQ